MECPFCGRSFDEIMIVNVDPKTMKQRVKALIRRGLARFGLLRTIAIYRLMRRPTVAGCCQCLSHIGMIQSQNAA